MIQLQGKVVKFASKEISTKDGTPLIKNEITLDVNGKQELILKFTKPHTTFALSKGTELKINATEQTDRDGLITYKVDSKPENFVLLNQLRKKPDGSNNFVKTVSAPAIQTEYKDKFGEGQKRGNALTNAISLLLHNKGKDKITLGDKSELLKLARMVFEVSTELETPTAQQPVTGAADDDETSPFD